jgi:long-chain acyl-CoA synthetase
MKQHISHMLRNRADQFGEREVFRFRQSKSKIFSKLNWNQLIPETNRVSKALISLGCEHESMIGIFSENRVEWTIADLGILAIRGIVVPFYATSSAHQAKYIIDETGIKVLFVGNQEQVIKANWLIDHCETLKKIIVFEDGDCPRDSRFMSWQDFKSLGNDSGLNSKLEKLLEDAQPEDLATVIYTSGTSGEPKGVMLAHENFMYAFKIHESRLNVTENDVSLCFLPLSHVFERIWTYNMLYCGAINTFLENPREVIETLPLAKPTVMCTVPRFFEKTYDGIQNELTIWPGYKKKIFNWSIEIGHQMIEFRKDAKKSPTNLRFKYKIADKLVLSKLRGVLGGNIKFMPCAGAAINPKLLRFFHATGLFITYGYGATETSATVSCFRSDIYDFDTCGSIMPGIDVKISTEGEILIKGKTIFKGYFKKPEATASVLIDGWYRTGDQGRLIRNEHLVMVDRIKDLMKTSVGKYISPQKLELLLGQDAFIEQIIVAGDNRKYVTALIVPSFENLRIYYKNLGNEEVNNETLIAMPEIIEMIKTRIDQLQQELTPYERIVKFTLLPEPFSILNNGLTNTLKVKRNLLLQKYNDLVEKMY